VSIGTLRVCPTPGCPNLTTGRRCASCSPTSSRNHGGVSRQARGYDADYEATRESFRGEPCELGLPGCTGSSTSADHFEGGLRPACKHCQDAQGAALARAR
jgi:hypothetical protein